LPKKPERSSFYKRFPPKSSAWFVLFFCLLLGSSLFWAVSQGSAASTPARPAFYPPPAATGTATPFLPAISPSPRSSGNRQCIWEGVEKIIAIGDLHGDYEHFITILQNEKIGLIDNKLNWIGGKTHLVQIGDIMDRGDDAKEIFDLIRRLEKEAVKDGGMVHMLIGNHEEMNITGIAFQYADYVTEKQFLDFLPDDYKKKKEREFKKRTEDGGDIEDEWKKLMEDEEARGVYVKNFNLLYGGWIAEEHNAVIKINDTVFVHGGINEKYSTWPLKDINNLYYLEFQKGFREGFDSFRSKILWAEDSPLWFRNLATWNEQLYASQVNQILANLGAKQIVIAHTPEIRQLPSRFGDKIWFVDTGISRVYHGSLSALIIVNGQLPRLWRREY
jgi:hypothetical protein